MRAFRPAKNQPVLKAMNGRLLCDLGEVTQQTAFTRSCDIAGHFFRPYFTQKNPGEKECPAE
jgi:hypothetical protein